MAKAPFLEMLGFFCLMLTYRIKGHKNQKGWHIPNVSKLDFLIFRGLTMVSQHFKGSYRVSKKLLKSRTFHFDLQNDIL